MTPTARPSRGYAFSSTASTTIATATAATTFVQSTRVLSLIRWSGGQSLAMVQRRFGRKKPAAHRFRCQREFGAMERTGSEQYRAHASGVDEDGMIRFEEKHILMSRSLWKRFIWEERRGEKRNICRRRKYHWFPRISFNVSREECIRIVKRIIEGGKMKRETFR